MLVAYVNQDPGIRPDSRKGAAVHVAAMRAALRAVLAPHGGRVEDLDETDDSTLAARLGALLAGRDGPALVYERYALGRATGSRVASAYGIPHVLEVNAPLIDEARRWRGGVDAAAATAVEREVYRRAHRILAVSELVADTVRAHGVPASRVVVRPNAVDETLFRPRARGTPHDVGPALGIPDTAFVLGFHGRLRPWHGFPRLVQAFRGLRAGGVPAHLLVVGEGAWHEHLRDLDHVTVLGWRPQAELGAIVARYDALPLTYDPDAPCYFSPLKLLESMAAGAVPVVPALGDLPAIVTDGVSGLIYPAGDVPTLTETLTRLARQPDLRVRLAAGAVARAGGRTWRALARDVVAWSSSPVESV